MSEVKTYRCDICKKVYHIGENHNEMIVAVRKDEKTDSYEHICPSCAGNISDVIVNPNIIKYYQEAADDERAENRKLRDMFVKIRDHMLCTRTVMFELDYKQIKEDIIYKYDELKKREFIWRIIGFAGIGSWIGMIIIHILTMVG